jgi:hypothetical protein
MVLAVGICQGQDPPAHARIGAIGWAATTIAVDDGRKALRAKTGSQPADLPDARAQQPGSRPCIEHICLQASQNFNVTLLFRVQGDCPHTSSMRTFSLSSDTQTAY